MAELMKDGYSTTITLANLDSSAFIAVLEEKSLTPPGVDGGDAIDTTTMRNNNYKTKAAQSLKEMLNASFTAAYNPEAYNDIVGEINVVQKITVSFPGSLGEIVFWGFVKSFTPNEHTPGEQPTAEIEIVPTSENSAGSETEVSFVSVT